MRRREWVWILVLTALTGWTAAATAEAGGDDSSSKKPAEPFYRKYLVRGDRLDDKILEQAQRVDASPNDANLRNDFGNLLAQRHFAREAAEQYELAAKLDKTNFVCLYNLGLLRETEGKVGDAMRAYRQSIARKRGFPPAHFRLGHLYEQQNRSDEAIEEYATALRIDPSIRDPRRNPLVVDSEMFYRASLLNYKHDMASAAMVRDDVYAEEGRFRAVPVDRPVTSQEAAAPEEAEPVNVEPRQIGVSDAAGTAPEGAAGGRRTGARPGAQEPTGTPVVGRPRSPQAPPRRVVARGGTPLVAAPPGAPVPAPPPPVEAAPPQTETENPPETMPEPTPAAPSEDEPS